MFFFVQIKKFTTNRSNKILEIFSKLSLLQKVIKIQFNETNFENISYEIHV